jgi:hypothetical protein
MSVRIEITSLSESSSAKFNTSFRLPRTDFQFGRNFFKYLWDPESRI